MTETTLDAAPLARVKGSELNAKSLFAAVIVAAIMGASYPYMVLKLGFGPNVSIVAAFFGFIILNIISRKTYDRWQNNIVQTAGTSAAQTAFMCGTLAAFDMLRESKAVAFDLHPTPVQIFIWLTCASLLGVLLAVPLRRHFVVEEKLPYPDGMAAGTTLMVLDPPRGVGQEDEGWRAAQQATRILILGLIASGLLMAFRKDVPLGGIIPEGWDTGALALGVAGASFVVAKMGVGFGYSLLSFGTGFLVSFRVNASMFVGGLIGWVLIPYFLVTRGVLHDNPSRTDVLYWVMWPGTGMIIAAGLTSLLLRWKLLVATFSSMRHVDLSHGEFPLQWVLGGSLVLSIALCVIQYVFLGIPVWVTVACLFIAVILMLVGLRALGETNWGPIGPMSNLTQAVFAVLAPGNATINIMSNATTGTVAVTSEGLMQDYKAGDMIGSTPRQMTYAQLLAAPIGAAALAVAYPALVNAYGIVGENAKLAAPGARRTAGFVELLSGGTHHIASSALWAMAIAAVIGIVLAVLEDRKAINKFVPSPTGLSLGMLLPFAAVSPIFVGSIIAVIWQRISPKSAGTYMVPLASGLIAGEALVAVAVALLSAAGLIHA